MGRSLIFVALLSSLGLIQSIAGLQVVFVGSLPLKLGFASSIYDGEDSVFLLGGTSGSFSEPADVLKFNLTTNMVTKVGSFPGSVARTIAAVGADGKGAFFFFGGWGMMGTEDDVFAFTAARPTPVKVAVLPAAMSGHTVASDGEGYIYIVGTSPDTEILKYDASNGTTEVSIVLTEPLVFPSSAWVRDSVYTFGEVWQAEPPNRIFKFTPQTGQLETLPSELLGHSMYASAVAVGDDIYVIGGINDSRNFRVLKFSTLTEKLEEFEVTNYSTQLLTPHAVYVPKSHRIYIFGGADQQAGIFYDDIFYIQL